jgi:hypothetical protein
MTVRSCIGTNIRQCRIDCNESGRLPREQVHRRVQGRYQSGLAPACRQPACSSWLQRDSSHSRRSLRPRIPITDTDCYRDSPGCALPGGHVHGSRFRGDEQEHWAPLESARRHLSRRNSLTPRRAVRRLSRPQRCGTLRVQQPARPPPSSGAWISPADSPPATGTDAGALPESGQLPEFIAGVRDGTCAGCGRAG